MILNEVCGLIDKLEFEGAMCQRAISLEIVPVENGTKITAWQCNMASMKTTDLRLPTVLLIILNEEGEVKEVELMENFKGSQGIPCSYAYLNRMLKAKLIGMSFLFDDSLMRNELMLHCRHLFELVAAAITFYRYCGGKNIQKKHDLFQLTRAFDSERGLTVKDEYHIDGKRFSAKQELVFRPSDIVLQADGKIGSINVLSLETEAYAEEEKVLQLEERIEDIRGSDNTIMSVMKLFSAPWKSIGKLIGVRRNYYFTNLLPSSIYGVLVQAISLKYFPNNYNYFQHSLAGLQRNGSVPLCVGMVLNKDELKVHFPEFREEDLLA